MSPSTGVPLLSRPVSRSALASRLGSDLQREDGVLRHRLERVDPPKLTPLRVVDGESFQIKGRNARRQTGIHRMPDAEPQPDGAIGGRSPGPRLNLAQMAFPLRVAMGQSRRGAAAPGRIDEDPADMPDAVAGPGGGADRSRLLKLQAQADHRLGAGRAVVQDSGDRVHVGEDDDLFDLVLSVQR